MWKEQDQFKKKKKKKKKEKETDIQTRRRGFSGSRLQWLLRECNAVGTAGNESDEPGVD